METKYITNELWQEVEKQAEKLAQKELKMSYPDIFVGKYADRFSCYEIKGEELLQRLTIN